MTEQQKPVRIRLDLEDDEANRFLRVKEHLGVKNDTEVVRLLLSRYWREHKEELLPPLEHFNLNEQGVLILDRTFRPKPRIIEVYFKPEGAQCEYCGSNKCRHVEFALSLPDVQEILRKKGWKISE